MLHLREGLGAVEGLGAGLVRGAHGRPLEVEVAVGVGSPAGRALVRRPFKEISVVTDWTGEVNRDRQSIVKREERLREREREGTESIYFG